MRPHFADRGAPVCQEAGRQWERSLDYYICSPTAPINEVTLLTQKLLNMGSLYASLKKGGKEQALLYAQFLNPGCNLASPGSQPQLLQSALGWGQGTGLWEELSGNPNTQPRLGATVLGTVLDLEISHLTAAQRSRQRIIETEQEQSGKGTELGSEAGSAGLNGKHFGFCTSTGTSIFKRQGCQRGSQSLTCKNWKPAPGDPLSLPSIVLSTADLCCQSRQRSGSKNQEDRKLSG